MAFMTARSVVHVGLFLISLAAMILWRDCQLANPLQGEEQIVEESDSPVIDLFFAGELDARPSHYSQRTQCVEVRIRGMDQSLSVDEAVNYLKGHYSSSSQRPERLNIGVSFLENPTGFISLKHGFHLYHFLEFFVIAYEELHRIANAGSPRRISTQNSTLAHHHPSLYVPWLNVPLLTRQEICGTDSKMNCLILDLILQTSSTKGASTHNFKTKLYGLESNDNITQSIHEAYRGHHWKRTKHVGHDYTPDPLDLQTARYQEMVSQVDAVLRVNRYECKVAQQQDYGLQKMWSAYIDDFPRQSWHEDLVSSGVLKNAAPNQKKLTVGYVDRQNTERHLPSAYHDWLVQFLTAHPKIRFVQLHMETYSPLQQIQLAAKCDVLVGMHGNGLSHALWMPPNRYVVELYWNKYFHWDYATLAQIMNHTYVAFQNGRVVDPIRVAQRDASLMYEMQNYTKVSNQTSIPALITDMEPVLEKFLWNVMAELGI